MIISYSSAFANPLEQGSIVETLDIDFIENRGQWDERVKFKASLPGGMVLLTERGFVYNFWKEEDIDRRHNIVCGQRHAPDPDSAGLLINQHAYSVMLKGARYISNWNKEGKRPYYHNYFIGNDSNNWKGNIGLYSKVVQEGVYPGIDLVVYSKGSSLKYDFYISSGADPSLIFLEFEGVHPQLLDDGSLKIQTSVNEVIEHAPYAYQLIDDHKVPVLCYYKLIGQGLSFTFPNGYNEDYPLIIDPELAFSTYSGSVGDRKIAYASTYDDEGNIYTGSLEPYYLGGGTGWPVTLGAYQTIPGGGICDMTISKFNSSGSQLIYATYYGGSGGEYPSGMVVNENKELIIVGPTNSPNLPVTSGCFDNTYNGNNDLFVVRFNNTGSSLLGATYIGSSGEEVGVDPINNQFYLAGYPIDYYEEINAVSNIEAALDRNGNIWVTSISNGVDFPVTSNALQNAKSGGYDGVLFQMNVDCSQLLYSTYLGGSGHDVLTNLILNNSGNVVVCGGTASSDFPTLSGALFSTPLGKTDGFVSVIDAQIGSLLHSTYLGTNQIDLANLLQVDADDNVYVLGGTQGNYPISPGVYHIPNTDLFIDKLSADLSQSLLSTRLGNRLNQGNRVKPISFLYDKACGNIYVSTIKASPTLPVTPDAYESSPRQFWFCVLNESFSSLNYATFFGSNLHSDHTHSGIHRFDKKGNLYMNICSKAADFPVTANAAYPRKLNIFWDNLAFKFDFELAYPHAGFRLLEGNDTTFCGVPYTINLVNLSADATDYIWDFGDGSPSSSNLHETHTYIKPGVYKITLFASNPALGCAVDSFSVVITINDHVYNEIDTSICEKESYYFVDSFITTPGVYYDTLKSFTGCDSFIKLDLTVSTLPELSISYNHEKILCVEDSINLLGSGAKYYEWFSNSKLIGRQNSASFVIPELSNWRICLRGISDYGCIDSMEVLLRVESCCGMFVPNAFSPNGDGNNDEFGPEFYHKIRSFRMLIFNRYGDLIFSSFSPELRWNGEYNNEVAELGVYYFEISGICLEGKSIYRTGDVTLIR